ncbi:DUF3151 domain-containing protein [Quadrisphaera sp. DSM 44207]|uniref:DUF3151 domain-containing protein n=1 Tax=Quadrisphaera sp. DSM 44207 TaxID=1881057 RepID=UPI00087EB74B|nr:DUF3151 domain-containing protein [Quadrisphaera sp. DSM 44207]SDQ87475.1 Protein of unknown function [Quadrisphaera sp. DSM 44207]
MPDSLPMPGATSGPPPTLLPEDHPDTVVARLLRERVASEELAARHPASSLAWAVLADEAFAAGRFVDAYAFARTGYHRGLDALRRAGWRGTGPVPWHHEPNRGVLRSIAILGRAAAALDEDDEAARCAQLLAECDPAAVDRLAGSGYRE